MAPRGLSIGVVGVLLACGPSPVIEDPSLPDAGPGVACGACDNDSNCERVAHCIATSAGSACSPRCDPRQPVCPLGFDCDGASSVCIPTNGVCCIDADSDTYGRGIGCAGADCDDSRASVNAGATEVCNGRDDDCDGQVDEELGRESCGVGACARTVDRCSNGTTQACVPGSPTSETCNRLDDDCDGEVDDGNPGGGASCTTGLPGACAAGTLQCVVGVVRCVANVTPTDDVCDGVDNDCDPTSVDGSEDPRNGAACDGQDSDLCLEGTYACAMGVLVCSDNTGSTLDLCNGGDDDCDPSSADGSEDPHVGVACDGPDSDLCLEGTRSCVMGALACSDTTGSTLDLCNGLDDDCDPTSADGSEDPQNNTACDGADSDLCLEGTQTCVMGALVCSDNTGSTLDVCNGTDDDCDPASADGSEDPLNNTACDGPDSDLCLEGTRSCVMGALVCSDNTASTVDVCNGADDDCDPASADGSEDPQNGAACDGPDSDLCVEGTRSCVMGALVCSDNTGSTLDLCNGVDDDCDPASADGSEDPLAGSACDGPDSDLCLEGTRTCVLGALVCSDTTGSNLDLCNGLDDDCDPSSADGTEDPQNGAACDGPDSDLCVEGTFSCVSGGLVCSDNTASTVDLCNGVDDDCDPASADGSEDPLNGAACDGPDSDLCLEGTRSCVSGGFVCSDTTGSSLDVCNGLDDDCDPASADGSEDPLNGAACDGPDSDLCLEGTRSCVSGGFVCSDNTASTVDLCNGVDDDCDPSSADGAEDPQNGAACDGPDTDLCLEGTRSCVSGALVCSDTTGNTVEVCGDGIDNDCNGAIDEGCCTNVVLDPGFEAGPPWTQWTYSSTNFTAPMCSVAGCCASQAWCGPRTGVYWAWFGGVAGTFEAGTAAQTRVIPVGANVLKFFLMIPRCASAGSDSFTVLIDGTPVWSATRTDPSCDAPVWVQKTINIASFADGASHNILFRGATDGQGTPGDQITHFMLDDIELCSP